MNVNTRGAVRERLATRLGAPSIDIGRKYPHKELDYSASLGLSKTVPLGNMSFCDIGDNLRLVAVRQFNYKCHWSIPAGEKAGYPNGFFGGRAYFFIITDRDFNFIRRVECDFEDLWLLEDIRLMIIDENTIQASATDVSRGRDKHRMGVWYFTMTQNDENGPKKLVLDSSYIFPVPKEKNYVPIVGTKGAFITDMRDNSFDMSTIFDLERKCHLYCAGIKAYRGSSPLLEYNGGYVALVHRKNGSNYINAFAFFDKAMTTCHYSKEFNVCSSISPINFVCGMAVEHGIAILPFCVNDRYTHLFKIPLADFANMR